MNQAEGSFDKGQSQLLFPLPRILHQYQGFDNMCTVPHLVLPSRFLVPHFWQRFQVRLGKVQDEPGTACAGNKGVGMATKEQGASINKIWDNLTFNIRRVMARDSTTLDFKNNLGSVMVPKKEKQGKKETSFERTAR